LKFVNCKNHAKVDNYLAMAKLISDYKYLREEKAEKLADEFM